METIHSHQQQITACDEALFEAARFSLDCSQVCISVWQEIGGILYPLGMLNTSCDDRFLE